MSLTLEDIQNLSTEVRTLVEARLPLEAHLAEAGSGQPKRLEDLTASITQQLENGESLEDVVRGSSVGASRMLAAAMTAGVKTGRLNTTIEMLGDMAGDLVGLRRRILQALSYPLTVLAVALLLFVVFIRSFLRQVSFLLEDHGMTGYDTLRQCLEFDARYWWWPILFPAAAGIVVVFWVATGRSNSLAFRGPERVLFLIPGVYSMVHNLQVYTYSRMLTLLVVEKLPLADALVVAGACSGNQIFDTASQTAAAQVQSGNLPAAGDGFSANGLPPLLTVALRQTGLHEDQLNERFSAVCGFYRRRLQTSVMWLQSVVPVAMLVIIGGGSVALYTASVFLPVVQIYRSFEVL